MKCITNISSKPFFLFISGWIFLFSSLALSDEPGKFLWPVQDDRVEVTSVLCDKRSGHPHGGIDISHFGQIGTIPIVSVDDGVLMRIRDSKYGYGKSLYIRMADKKIAVYAHLASFSPKIQAVANELRRGTGLSKLDYYYEPWEMNVEVKRGEIIGYGGNSGTSTAHLHFELRYDDIVNLNPLTNGFSIPDSISPTIKGVMLVPIDPDATVDGAVTSKIVRNGQMERTFDNPIQVSGRVGISVDTYDRHRTKGRSFSPYRIQVSADGKPFSEMKYESWGYIDQTIWSTQFDYDPTGKVRMYRAYNPYPADIPLFSGPESGILDQLEAGEHTVEVAVFDAAGNHKEVSFKIDVIQNPDPQKRPWPRGHGKQVLFNKQKVSSVDGRMIVEGDPFSFFEPVAVDIAKVTPPEMNLNGPCYEVSNPDVFVRQAFNIKMKYIDHARAMQTGLYRIDSDGISWMGNEIDWDQKTVTGRTMKFGTYCIAIDDEPPVIGGILKSKNRKRPLRFTVTDSLSGMDRNFVLVTIDGKLAMVNFNNRSGKASVTVPWKQKPGTHHAKITAIDRAGNIAEENVTLQTN